MKKKRKKKNTMMSDSVKVVNDTSHNNKMNYSMYG